MLSSLRQLSLKPSALLLCLFMSLPLLTACGGGDADPGTEQPDQPSEPVVPPDIYTNAPSGGFAMQKNAQVNVNIGGGTPPYTALSSNASVADVAVNDTMLVINAKQGGEATAVITDSAGKQLSIAVAVDADVVTDFRTTAPAALNLGVNEAAGPYAINGGTAPYTCVSDNNSVVKVTSCSATELRIQGLADGTAKVFLQDATNAATLQIAVNVANNTGLTVTGSSDWTIPAAHCSAAPYVAYNPPVYSIYFINGGTPPYKVSSTSPLIGTIIGTEASSSSIYTTEVAPGTTNTTWTVYGGGYFVVAWPDKNVSGAPANHCAQGSAEFNIVDANGLQPQTVPTFKITVAQ